MNKSKNALISIEGAILIITTLYMSFNFRLTPFALFLVVGYFLIGLGLIYSVIDTTMLCKNNKPYFEHIEKHDSHYLLPKRGTTGSAGYDFYAPYDITLEPNKSIVVSTGIRAVMNDPRNVLLILPRSGLGFKYRCSLANTVGVIDSDYYSPECDGNIAIKLVNGGDTTFKIYKGTGMAQGIFVKYDLIQKDVSNKIRSGGFGSTTK